MNKFNTADKVLCSVFILFLVFLAIRILLPENTFIRFLLFCSEAALVGGIADWFAVTALFKKPLGIPFHTAILPKKRDAFIESCIKMLQTEFLSKKKIYRRICNADLLAKGLEWLKKPSNKEYFVHIVISFLLEKISSVDLHKVASAHKQKFIDLILKESIHDFSEKLIIILNNDKNSKIAVDKTLYLLNNYFAGTQGKKRVLNFIEAYQRQYTKNGLTGFALSIALATNALDPEELADVIHNRIIELLEEATQKNTELYTDLTTSWNEFLQHIGQNESFINSLNDLRDYIIQSDIIDKILYNMLNNLCDYLVTNSGEGNKLHMAITHIMYDEIDNCIAKLYTNAEFKSKINRFILDILHRSALKGEDMILSLARKFLEGLTDEQLNELVYDKVEKDMIWIRLNGSIVGGFIGIFVFWILEVIK